MDELSLQTLISREHIAERVRLLADEISRDFQSRTLLLVGVLKGAFVFVADLIRHLSIPVEVDFIRVASYGDSMESQELRITKDLELPVRGRDVLVVEDIVDTGRTLSYLQDILRRRGARTVSTCVLVDKRQRRRMEVSIDYVGFVVQEGFIVGYGLDYAESYRHLPDLCVVGQSSGKNLHGGSQVPGKRG